MNAQPLQTARLCIRAYTPADAEDYVAVFTSAETMRYVDGALTQPQARRLFDEIVGRFPLRRRVHTAWAVETSAGAHVGHVALLRSEGGDEIEIGYLLRPAHWGRGYATEIAAAVLRYARGELGLARVIATADEGHGASRRVLEKVGMRAVRREVDESGAWWVYETT